MADYLPLAVTRATSLCIIVGNPYLMMERSHWKALMQHCVDRKVREGERERERERERLCLCINAALY